MMQFRRARKLHTKEVSQFSGMDSSVPESELALHAAADMANVYVDALGRICKRTGYKKLFSGDGRINGIFCFEYRDDNVTKKQYFIHVGTKLYLCALSDERVALGECISENLEDKKSRSFAFGGALYILGAGYYKIMWDAIYKMFVCGRISKTETEENATSVIADGCAANAFPFGGTKNMVMSAECRFKEIRYAYGQHDFTGGEKLYVAPPELAEKVHIERVQYEKSDGTLMELTQINYDVGQDSKGLYVLLYRRMLNVDASIYCAPRVLFNYNNFVYNATNVLSRTPTLLKSFYDSYVASEHFYDGDFLEGYNLCAPHRAVEFRVKQSDYSGGDGLRFYLEPGYWSCRVLRVFIDGKLVQKYGRYSSTNGSVPLPVVIAEATYVDIAREVLPGTECTVRVEYLNMQPPAAGELTYVMDACKVFGIFGGKNDTRVFLSGNPDWPGYDFASGLYDASYFSDKNYTMVGSDCSEIIGYHKISGYQVILKDGKNFDSTQYLRSFSLSADGKTTFIVQQGAQGIAACGVSSFKTCRDHMLFAGRDGVYEIRGTDVEAQTNLKCLSEAVGVRIASEPMQEAVCAVLENRYYLALGTKMYILDLHNGPQWYCYTDLPQICCLYTEDAYLYFGAADGGFYRFMAAEEADAYYDNVGADGDKTEARAIRAFWDVPVTTLGNGMCTKSIEDMCIYLAPQPKSSLRVYYTTEHCKEAYRHGETVNRLDFSDWDFAGFSFDASDYPMCINTRAKAKRVRVFGARIENAEPGEGMCISGVAVRYIQMKPIK